MNGQARLRRMAAEMQTCADAALARAGRQALAAAREACPVRTGALRASLALRREGKSLILSARAPYALLSESKKPFLRPAAKAAALPGAAEEACKEAIR